MRKLLFLTALLGVLGLSVPVDLSFAGPKRQVVQGKAKKAPHYKAKRPSAYKKKATYKRPRYAKNINRPQEGELLKLEGMVRDLNEH
ncbi:MAG: hypothetical protein NZ560_04420 [Aquificaceae bacterium]|nr:hypothetical protein [Aquificaceae bacterium]MDW8097454.1 hypothetical protein [Aquificaceae bacterium]